MIAVYCETEKKLYWTCCNGHFSYGYYNPAKSTEDLNKGKALEARRDLKVEKEKTCKYLRED